TNSLPRITNRLIKLRWRHRRARSVPHSRRHTMSGIGRVDLVRVVFAGTPETAVSSLDALLASRHEVCAVLTRPDAPSGRGRRVQPSPVAQRADELELEILKPDTPSDGEFM